MSQVEDTGKVWIPGNIRPEYAVRVGGRVFVIGQEDGETLGFWVDHRHLCVDRHDRDAHKRLALSFQLDLPPSARGTLFEGFTATKHGDVAIVVASDPGVKTYSIEAEEYVAMNVEAMDRAAFFALAGLLPE
jgi:hypothetical protein